MITAFTPNKLVCSNKADPYTAQKLGSIVRYEGAGPTVLPESDREA